MTNEPTSTEAGITVKPPFLTFVLIAINVLIYIMIQYQGGPTYENLVKYGAKENGLIAEGEIGRLFFPMFLHASPAHILFNMFALYQFGRVFEVLTGARNLFVTYVLGGLLGNAVSFSFSGSLSVGASSSLFALLFALYVLERYQQKITVETTGIKTRTSLGPVIVINAIITFLIPNIDWASHLGGAIAGAFIGIGLVMKHKLNVRMMSMVKYWRVDPQTLKLKFFQREGFYLGTISALVLLSLLKIPRVAFADRVFGLGVLEASQSTMQGHGEIELPSYRSSFDDASSPANPESMLHQALAQHVAGRYEVSATMFSILQKLNQRGLGSPEFASKSTQALLEQALDAALARQPLEPTLVRALMDEERAVAPDPSFCRKSAEYVRGLGFYALSGLLYKCAFYEDYGNKEHARSAIADLWQETRRCEETPHIPDDQSTEDHIAFVRQARRSCYHEIDLFRTQLLREQQAGRLNSHGATAMSAGNPPSVEQGL
ncbi:MAG: rhomboid family intramembrane serine protease [Silvanigrellaceae bacterium]